MCKHGKIIDSGRWWMLTDLDITTTVTGLHFQASYLKFMNKLFGVTLYFLYL